MERFILAYSSRGKSLMRGEGMAAGHGGGRDHVFTNRKQKEQIVSGVRLYTLKACASSDTLPPAKFYLLTVP